MKKTRITSSLIFLFTIFSSYDFWLQPNKFIYDRGEEINFGFLSGENFSGKNWSSDSTQIKNISFYYGGVKDELPLKLFDGKGDSLHLRQYDEGTNMLSFTSYNSFKQTEAGAFNGFLAENVMSDLLEYRKEHNETDSAANEFVQWNAKTIFQVGKVKDETYKQSTVLPLDIIPLSHPYKHTDGAEMNFKILFQHAPLTGAKIKVWYQHKGETEKTELITNEKGEVKFSVKTSGRWMVSCMKMIRLEKINTSGFNIPWQSYWGSCTWGYY